MSRNPISIFLEKKVFVCRSGHFSKSPFEATDKTRLSKKAFKRLIAYSI